MATFLTGATGFIGRFLTAQLLKEGEEVVALVRCRTQVEGFTRLRRALASVAGDELPDLESRLRICPGELSAPGLGLSLEDHESVVADCERFLHCGAATRFDLALEAARVINVGGTIGLLDLARERQRRQGVERIDVVSTAYVAGFRTDLVREAALDGPTVHKNNYERTKFEAEHLVWRAASELPVCVFRPSVVVGESTTGRTFSFNTLYVPIRIYARGLWRTIPANADTRIDLVPVDFVRDALIEIRRRPDSLGRCFHLAAGPGGEATIGELARIVEGFFPGRRPVRFADPERWMRFAQPLLRPIRFGRVAEVVSAIESYLPYFIANPRFDVANTRKALADSGLALPDVRSYIERLLRYCVESDWGRKTL